MGKIMCVQHLFFNNFHRIFQKLKGQYKINNYDLQLNDNAVDILPIVRKMQTH